MTFAHALDTADTGITLMVSGTRLLSSRMLERLCLAADRLEELGLGLTVVCADEDVRRLLVLAGFARRFEFVPSTNDPRRTTA